MYVDDITLCFPFLTVKQVVLHWTWWSYSISDQVLLGMPLDKSCAEKFHLLSFENLYIVQLETCI